MVEQSQVSAVSARIDALHRLCDSLGTPGTQIPANADHVIASGLMARDFDPIKLCNAALSIFASNPTICRFMEAAWADDHATLAECFDSGTLTAFVNTPLMQALLITTPVPVLAFEKLLTYMRRRFLEGAMLPDQNADEAILKAVTAISNYAFLTEYVLAESPAELDAVSSLSREVLEKLEAPDLLAIVLLGAYRPLADIENISGLIQKIESNPALANLVRLQVLEPGEERKIIETLPAITGIENEASVKVRAQYEEHPYPRWVGHIHNGPVSPQTYFRGSCTGVDLEQFGDAERCEVLAAGCGTGRVAIEEQLLWQESKVTALDLSLASLAYGCRRARELSLNAISFVHGDILKLPELDRSFDYITCTGVLHHMADPLAGWQALANVCRPGGIMRVCLYSDVARKAIRQVRDSVQAESDGSNATAMRQVRASLIEKITHQDPVDENLRLTFAKFDMYTMSMCRDLLFHVQEQDFTIPKIADAVRTLGLNFCGFVDPTQQILKAYKTFAPHDALATDLESWDRFEAANPHTFVGMYDFMVQKPV